MPKIKNKTKIKNQKNQEELSIKNLKSYISSAKKLSYEEILWLFRKKHEYRTDQDITHLVDSNLAMVYTLAIKHHKYHNRVGEIKLDFIDLYNAGVIGLYIAIKKFDSTKNTQFSTFAYPWISAYIRKEIRNCVYPLKTYNYAPVKVESIDTPYYHDRRIVDPYQTIQYNDLIDVIRKILSDVDYSIFNLSLIEGRGAQEIADIMNLPCNKISNRIKKIKEILLEKLTGEKLAPVNKRGY